MKALQLLAVGLFAASTAFASRCKPSTPPSSSSSSAEVVSSSSSSSSTPVFSSLSTTSSVILSASSSSPVLPPSSSSSFSSASSASASSSSSAASGPCATNLVVNGDFAVSTGNQYFPPDWRVSFGVGATFGPRSGSGSCSPPEFPTCFFVALNSDGTTTGVSLYQDLTGLIPQTEYALQFTYRVPFAPPPGGALECSVTDLASGTGATTIIDTSDVPAGFPFWNQGVLTFSVPSTSAQLACTISAPVNVIVDLTDLVVQPLACLEGKTP